MASSFSVPPSADACLTPMATCPSLQHLPFCHLCLPTHSPFSPTVSPDPRPPTAAFAQAPGPGQSCCCYHQLLMSQAGAGVCPKLQWRWSEGNWPGSGTEVVGRQAAAVALILTLILTLSCSWTWSCSSCLLPCRLVIESKTRGFPPYLNEEENLVLYSGKYGHFKILGYKNYCLMPFFL